MNRLAPHQVYLLAQFKLNEKTQKPESLHGFCVCSEPSPTTHLSIGSTVLFTATGKDYDSAERSLMRKLAKLPDWNWLIDVSNFRTQNRLTVPTPIPRLPTNRSRYMADLRFQRGKDSKSGLWNVRSFSFQHGELWAEMLGHLETVVVKVAHGQTREDADAKLLTSLKHSPRWRKLLPFIG